MGFLKSKIGVIVLFYVGTINLIKNILIYMTYMIYLFENFTCEYFLKPIATIAFTFIKGRTY